MRTTSGSVRGAFSSAPLPVIIITEDFIWLESERHEELPTALGYNLMRHAQHASFVYSKKRLHNIGAQKIK